jgi:hypothetical protein
MEEAVMAESINWRGDVAPVSDPQWANVWKRIRDIVNLRLAEELLDKLEDEDWEVRRAREARMPRARASRAIFPGSLPIKSATSSLTSNRSQCSRNISSAGSSPISCTAFAARAGTSPRKVTLKMVVPPVHRPIRHGAIARQ